MTVQPDLDTGRPTSLDSLVTEAESTPLRVLAATFATAQRTGLPLYSDDRHVRLLARGAGMRTLSTAGLLDALQADAAVPADQVADARRRLRAEGFIGVTPRAAELAELLAASDGEPGDPLRAAFYDPAPWRAAYAPCLMRVLEFLLRVWQDYPEKFEAWMLRLLAAMLDRVGLTRADRPSVPVRDDEALLFHGEWLLAAAWLGAPLTGPEGRPFLSALRAALGAAMRKLGTATDPLPGAVRRYERLVQQVTNSEVQGITPSLLVQMPFADQMRVLGLDPLAAPPLHSPSGYARSVRVDEAMRRLERRSDRGRRDARRRR